MSQDHRASVIRRLAEELELFFVNEVADDRLQDVALTGVRLSPDKRVVTVRYLPPEGEEDAVADALRGLVPVMQARAAEVLHHTPDVRFEFDHGAGNERRVSQILDELRTRGELPPDEDAADGPEGLPRGPRLPETPG